MDSSRPVIDAVLVARLVASEFPQWAGLAVTPVEWDGWDNRTFRLGTGMSVRLPSGAGYTEQVAKEQYWLPILAPQLPLPIPLPLAMGHPAAGYHWNWSVYRWLEGTIAAAEVIDDLDEFATALAKFLVALRAVDPTGGPSPGQHNWFRGGPLETYDAQTRDAIAALAGDIPAERTTALWDAALAATWRGSPVWFHGDVAAGNLLVRDGRLSAVIDFGTSGIGDPSCDLAITWTFFSGTSRDIFRTGIDVDAGTWARGRGWALWKALITLAGEADPRTDLSVVRGVVTDLLAEHEQLT